jgi:hypothetical protein
VFVAASAASTLDDETDRLEDDAWFVEIAALVISSALSTLEDELEI